LTLLLLFLPRLLGVLAILLRGQQAEFGGSLRLWGSALLELLLSVLQAPLRMLAHSVFVLSALTGLRLDWKSPAREAAAVAWRDAMSRVGSLALPALGLALLMLALHGQPSQAAYLAPLLLPLLLAVPFVVWSGGAAPGRALRRAGLLAVPEERQPPRALSRGAHKMGFSDLQPAAPAVAITTPRRAAPALMALASAALVALVLLPRTALSPELPIRMPTDLFEMSTLSEQRVLPMPTQVASVRPQRSRPYRPASTIDDAVRQRAYEAVARTLAPENG
jgi:membrane glycosyltransferase